MLNLMVSCRQLMYSRKNRSGGLLNLAVQGPAIPEDNHQCTAYNRIWLAKGLLEYM